MVHKVIDRCKETTSTTGTGTLTLTGAVANFVAVADATAGLTADGDTSWFCAENGSEWEIFLGTRMSSTTLARTTVIASSNAGAAVNFTSPPTVFCTVPASKLPAAGPAFSAYLTTNNQSLTTGVAAKIQLNAEDFDVGGCFDSTTNYRFTPNVAGYYSFSGSVRISGISLTAVFASIYKNGTEKRRLAQTSLSSGNLSAAHLTGSAVFYMNGTTDYVELWAYGVGTTPVVEKNEALTFFSGHFVRGG